MKIGYYVNGSIRRKNQNNEDYDYVSHHQLLAKELNADLMMSSWANNTDPHALSAQEIIDLDADIELLNNPSGRYPDLYWQHIGFCNLVGEKPEDKYDVIIRARWDNVYTDESIEIINQSVTSAHMLGDVSGFVSKRYDISTGPKILNDHLIVTNAGNFNYEFAQNFLELGAQAWSLVDNVRQCGNIITKAEYVWWWLICGRYNLKYSNYHL